MTRQLRTLRSMSLAAALMCSTALSFPFDAGAAELSIDMDATITNNGLTVGPGDTLIVIDGVTVTVHEQAGLEAIDADGATLINNGTIFTTGTTDDSGFGDGMFIWRSTDVTAINNGLISVGDNRSFGIFAFEGTDRFTGINNGTIVIRQDAAVENLANDNGTPNDVSDDLPVLDPNGVPYQTAETSAGLGVYAYTDADTATTGHLLVNNNLILSYVLQSRGMVIAGFDGAGVLHSVHSTIINNNSIRMLSDDPSNGTFDVSGMRIEGHHGTIINNGYIEINPRGGGIEMNGSGGQIYNYGMIVIDGENIGNARSYGIEQYRNANSIDSASNNLTVNTGTIITTGPITHGVLTWGRAGHDVVNAGRILAMGGGYSIMLASEATDLDGSDGSNSLTLLNPSILYGDTFLNVASTAVQNTTLHLGDGLNARVRFDTVNGGRPTDAMTMSYHNSHVWVDDSLYVADLDSYQQQDQALWHMATMLQGVLDNGANPRQASRELRFANSGRNLWGRAFGGGLRGKEDGDSAAPDYRAGTGGVVAGTNTGRFQFFGGLAQTNVRGDEEVSYETKSISGFGGLSGRVNKTISYSIMAGGAINSTDRDVADNTVAYGIDTDSTNYASVFFAPSVSLAGPVKGSSLRLMYAGLWQQGHSFDFSGGTQLDVDNRFAHFVQARFEMQHQVTKGLTFGYGAEASWSGAKDMSFDLMGTSMNTPYDSGAFGRIFAKADFGFGFVEVGRDTEERTTVQAGARVKF